MYSLYSKKVDLSLKLNKNKLLKLRCSLKRLS